jgi:hypothetical protein
MQAETILARLAKVRKTGANKWAACCPAHQDRSPSLAIKQLPDGRVLMHCFGGCGTDDVLASLGLEMADLFPEPLGDLPRVRGAFTAHDALVALTQESAIVALVAADTAEGKPISPTDADRACKAAGRIAQALEAIHS